MGEVVRFPRHARASAGSNAGIGRACMAARQSSVTPSIVRPAAIETSGSQYSGGMRPRCAHLLTAEAEMSCPAALKSSDTASRVGHRSKIARGVSNMPPSLGPYVLNVKANVSCDESVAIWDTLVMDRMSETEEKAAFISRVRAAREARFPTQKPMLTILGIDQGTYKQYETRTPLPHRFIPKFCAACGVSMEWLLTGEGPGPMAVPLPPKRKREASLKPRKRLVA